MKSNTFSFFVSWMSKLFTSNSWDKHNQSSEKVFGVRTFFTLPGVRSTFLFGKISVLFKLGLDELVLKRSDSFRLTICPIILVWIVFYTIWVVTSLTVPVFGRPDTTFEYWRRYTIVFNMNYWNTLSWVRLEFYALFNSL